MGWTDLRGSVLMQKYEIGRLLGKGTFAKVYHAKHLDTRQDVAIKVIDKNSVVSHGLMEQIMREIHVMRMVRHPNIVQLHEVMATKSKIYFVLEYVKGGELFKIVSAGRLKEDATRRYFQQLIAAVEFCHSRGVYHRDLKPENLLLDEGGNLKISDFGLSALTESKKQDGMLHTACGTPVYVAPEVITRKGYDGDKADIWSCGVILYTLMAGFLPFRHANLMELYKKIAKAQFKCPPWFPPDLRQLLAGILDPCPRSRITIGGIMDHPWFRHGLDGGLLRHRTEDAPGASVDDPVSRDVTSLNAFDIISLSEGLDLSRIFVEPESWEEMRFVSEKPIISKLEEIARTQRLTVAKKAGGLVKMEGSNSGRKGYGEQQPAESPPAATSSAAASD